MIDIHGLRAALEQACPDCEIDAHDWPGGPAVVLRRGDRAAEVFWHREKSVFRVRYSWPRMFMNRVHWTDLAEAAGSAATWLSGATPREFAAAWPFADFVAVADAFESGDRIEYRWQVYRAHLRDHREFIEVALTEPRLRCMFPFTSMWWMSFRPTADEFRVPGPWVRAVGNGRFTVVPQDRRIEPEIDYGPAEAVQVCVVEMDRLGVPRPEDLTPRSELRPPAGSDG
ncbi:DUF6193 family natural product biosynthesis protein [Kutzneria chonburiensis]|uniref:DUF6193 family natural product biosynthesis protein n=1 Tax=Kutzneria chonburiensis TaxID=1483604 RepID=A0ABV6MKW7_9PSEU|nr:DUF6193 family natural product biosynthesis protein [Kutzneria chonburiensis]